MPVAIIVADANVLHFCHLVYRTSWIQLSQLCHGTQVQDGIINPGIEVKDASSWEMQARARVRV
jgi:hypothetical protein